MFQTWGNNRGDFRYPQEVKENTNYIAPDMEIVKLEMQLPLLSGESGNLDMPGEWA